MRIRVFKRKGQRGVRWYLDFVWADKRWRYPVADKKSDADEIKARIQIQIAEGTFKGPQAHEQGQQARSWTMGRLGSEWYAIRRPKLRPATCKYYEDILRGIRDHFGEDRLVGSLTWLDCQKFLASKRAESDSPVRHNRYLTVLRSLFAFAIDAEVVLQDPTRRLKKEREPRPERFLTGDEMARLLDAADGWLRPIILTAYYTGARRGDLVGDYLGKPPLTWANVDLRNRRISFQNTKERKPRTRRIGKELLEVLLTLPSRPSADDNPEDKPVFVDEAGQRIAPHRAYRRFKAAALAAKIDEAERLRFHDLKHTHVSGLLAQGYSLAKIQEYVGHSSPYMTMRYAHLADKDLDEMSDGLTGTIQAHAADDREARDTLQDAK